MKKAIIALLLLQANLAVSADTIIVEGVGSSREVAKQDAFRTAIENICGTAVLSDREHFNDNTTYNNITTYSSCRVENYKILEDNGNRLKMRVTVSDSRLSQRLYSNGKMQFDGGIVNAQITTLRQEHKNGDKLIDSVFRDYPYRAYNLHKTKEPYITVDSYRNTFLMVPFDIRWNKNFVNAMDEVFSLIESSRGAGIIQIMNREKYFVDDLSRLEYIKTKFGRENEMRLKIKARDTQGKNVLNICYNPEYKAGGIFYSMGVSRRLTIFGHDRNSGTMKVKLTIPADVVHDIFVDVVAERDCKL